LVFVETGDIIAVPAGEDRKTGNPSADLGVVGAYPDGRSYWLAMIGLALIFWEIVI
jgi:uncharacterized protein YjlB